MTKGYRILDGTRVWIDSDRTYTEHPDGTKSWFKKNLHHREDGPAIVWWNGNVSWYLEGTRYSNWKEYQRAAKLTDEDMTSILLLYSDNNFN